MGDVQNLLTLEAKNPRKTGANKSAVFDSIKKSTKIHNLSSHQFRPWSSEDSHGWTLKKFFPPTHFPRYGITIKVYQFFRVWRVTYEYGEYVVSANVTKGVFSLIFFLGVPYRVPVLGNNLCTDEIRQVSFLTSTQKVQSRRIIVRGGE